LNKQYGASGVYIGVPAVIGKNGYEQIIEWKLNSSEKTKFLNSVKTLNESYLVAKKALS
jgi:L-lactate dehydrogenase